MDLVRRRPSTIAAKSIVGLLLIAQGSGLLRGAESLFLLSATAGGWWATPFESNLHVLDVEGKSLKLVRAIGKPGEGSKFVLADFDRRVLVVGVPNSQPKRLEIIKMDGARILDSRTIPIPAPNLAAWDPRQGQAASDHLRSTAQRPGDPPVSFRYSLLDVPGTGLAVRVSYGSEKGTLEWLVPTDATVSARAAAPDENARIKVSGWFGLDENLGFGDSRLVRVRNKKIVEFSGQSQETVLPIPPLPDFWDIKPREAIALQAYNKSVVVLQRPFSESTSDVGNGSAELAILDQSTQTWRSHKVTGSRSSVKAIGSWVIGTSCTMRDAPGSAGQGKQEQVNDLDPGDELERVSDGTSARFGPWWTAETLRTSRVYFPGILWAIDVTRGRYYEMTTNVANSEIVFIDPPVIYFRVDTKLYKAEIRGDRIGPREFLAEHPALINAHWAFLGR